MCIYTVKKQNFFKKLNIPQGGCTTPSNVLKLGLSCVKDTAKKLTKFEACHVT